MTRLPIPGNDDQTWGDILNDFLRVEHNEDGTLKAGGSLANKYVKPPSGIPENDLTSAVQTKLNTVGTFTDGSITTAKIQDAAITPQKLNAALQAKLAAVSGMNSGDQDLSGLVTKVTKVNGHSLDVDVTVTKTDVGLSNVDNTADLAKPLSTATQAALTAKYTKPGTGIPETDLASAVQTKLNAAASATITANDITDATAIGRSVLKATDAGAARTAIGAGTSNLVVGTTSGTAKAGDYVPTKADVGLASVDNTSDVNKPISSAAQIALNAKYVKPLNGIPTTDLEGDIPETKLSSAVQGKLNSAGTLADGSVGTSKLADNAVTTAKITDGIVTKVKLSSVVQSSLDKADSALQSIADGSIGTSKLVDNAVTAAKITDATVTEVKLASAVQAKLNQAAPDLSQYFSKTTNTTDDITEGTTKKFISVTDKTKLANLTGTNSGDQDLSGLVPKTTTVNGHALSGNVVITPADLNVTKNDIGLGNVDNTSDVNKPISTAAQTAFNTKANANDVIAALAAKAATADVSAALANKATAITATASYTADFTAVVSTKHTVDATSGAISVTLPATNELGQLISVQKSDASVNLVVMTGKINGVSSSTSTLRSQYQGKLLAADGTGNWNIIAGDVSVAALDTRYTDLTSAQTVNGLKTFSVSPVVPTPVNNNDAVNKAYSDTKVDLASAQTVTGAKSFNGAASFTGGLTSTSLAINAGSLTTDTTTGLRIGSTTTQKIGFFNATPIVQPIATTELGVVLSSLGLRAVGTAFPITTSGIVNVSGPFVSSASVRSSVSNQTVNVNLNTSTSGEYQMCNATSAAFTVTLPSVTTHGYRFTIKKIDSSTNAVTIAGTIDGVTNYVLAAQYKYVTLVSTTTSGVWYVVGNN